MKSLFLTLLCFITRKSDRTLMFTGIVIDVGIIKSLKKNKKKEIEMTIYTENIASLKEGMSISCAGICLTVVSYKKL
ncbi:MAG: hypothetical protein ACJ0A7_06425 [Alphaproteobacteria bacterium]